MFNHAFRTTTDSPGHLFGNRGHPGLVLVAQREMQQQVTQVLDAEFGEFGRKSGGKYVWFQRSASVVTSRV